MGKVTLSIIIPTLNEEQGIAKTIGAIPKEIREVSEVIVVDVSDDSTPVIAQTLGAKVLRPGKRGKGFQMRYGASKSTGDVLIFLDGDGTDPGEYIPKMLVALKNANLVLGCRGLQETKNVKMRLYFRLWMIIAFLPSMMLGLKVSDPLAGFRAIRRKDWDALDLQSNGFEIETEMNIKAMKKHFIIKEVPIPNIERAGGLKSSKFGRSPNMWFKILKMILYYKLNK